MTGIVICADDYGMHPEVDRAIVDLARQRRLSATSVLVDGDDVHHRARDLSDLDIDVGLHLNLTEQVGGLHAHQVDTRLGHFIVACYRRRVSRDWVEDAVSRQLDRYESIFNRPPAYIDGHQHVHQLPVVRDVLMAQLRARYMTSSHSQAMPWIRSTRSVAGLMKTGFRQWLKAKVIESLGAVTMERMAHNAGLQTNRGFAGVYDFTKPALPYDQLLKCWLDTCGPGALIMCHPSAQVLDQDPVGQARLEEYRVLSSPDMGQWLAQLGLEVLRLSQVVGSKSSLP